MRVTAIFPAVLAAVTDGGDLAAGHGSLFFISFLGGVALALAAIAVKFARAGRGLELEVKRREAEAEALGEASEHLRAVLAVEPQAIVLWRGGAPILLHNTLEAAAGAPATLQQLLRFGSWLDPADAIGMTERLERLEVTGETFAAKAATASGAHVEIIGGGAGADMMLRIRRPPVHDNDLTCLTAENARLARALEDREALLDALPFPVWIRSPEGSLGWVNAAYAASAGARTAAHAVAGQVELFETRQRAELARALALQKPVRSRLQTVVDGSVQIHDVIAAPLPRGSGGAALNVAPLATAQDELHRQTAAHARTLDKVSTGVAIFDAGRKLAYHNDALARIWKLDGSFEATKPAAAQFFDHLRQRRLLPEQSNYRKWRDERLLAWENSGALDEFWHLPDGRTMKVLSDHREDGGATFLFDDVTEKLAIERQYHNLMEVQRETLDHLNEGIAVFAPNGRLQLRNPAFQSIWDLPASALDGRPHLEHIIQRCAACASEQALWDAARRAITNIPEARETFGGAVQREDGTHLAYSGTPLPDGGTLLTFADITDTKRIEVVLLEKNEALEASDRLKTTFLSHVSYELRTPLTSIIGFTELLAEPHLGQLSHKQREYLNDIKTSSQVLLTIINDILDLAVIEAGALELRLAPTPVADVIEEAELGLRERLARAKVHLDVHVAPGAEMVTADASRLTQILFNLLSNAIGFSPEGGTITLACRRDKNGVKFSVQDTGLGIPEEEQAAIFERFKTKSHGSRHRGAGLGLAVVKSLVELHNGRIELRSAPGAGTMVSVFLPDRHSALAPPLRKSHGLSVAAPR